MANYSPDLALALFKCGKARDEAKGRPLQERAVRINNAISGRYGVPGVKSAMNLAGFRAGVPRRPLLPLIDSELNEQKDFLTKERLI